MPSKITEEKLEKYFYEASKHRELLLDTLDVLEKIESKYYEIKQKRG